jgi:hypothetical protein
LALESALATGAKTSAPPIAAATNQGAMYLIVLFTFQDWARETGFHHRCHPFPTSGEPLAGVTPRGEGIDATGVDRQRLALTYAVDVGPVDGPAAASLPTRPPEAAGPSPGRQHHLLVRSALDVVL